MKTLKNELIKMNASYQIRRKIIINMKDSLEQSCSRLFNLKRGWDIIPNKIASK